MKNNFDIVFITETHLTKGTRFSIPDFTPYHNPLSDHNDKKPHGGVSCFIKTSVLQFVKKVHTNTKEFIVVEMVGGHKIFGCYIVPRDSPYADEGDFAKISNVFSPRNCDTVIIGGGDVNSRVGDMKVRLPAQCSYRKNVDEVTNEYGKLLTSVCQTSKCFILNNMNIGSVSLGGDYTFRKGSRKSQNDLILSNKSGLSVVQNLTVHNTIWNPSDHTPVSIDVELDVTNNNLAVMASLDILSQNELSDIKKAKKVGQNEIDWDAYKTLVENDFTCYKDKVQLLEQKKDLNTLDSAVDALSDSLYKSADTISPQPTQRKQSSPMNDDPLLIEAEKLHKHWEQGDTTTEEWNSVREEIITHLKTNTAAKERNTWLTALQERDPKAVWQKINWKGNVQNNESSKPSLDDLREHFLKKGESMEDSTLL